MEKLRYRIFTLELTRRCNLKCAHCCKGDAQNLDMTTEVLHKALDNLTTQEEFVKSGRFTESINLFGGEPFLNPKLVHECVEYIIKNNIFILGFQTTTNGTKLDKNIAMDFNRIASHVDKCWEVFLKYTKFKKEELLKIKPVFITISMDFHIKSQSEQAYQFYRRYCNDKVNVQLRDESEHRDGLLYSGRTKEIFRSNDKKKYIYTVKDYHCMATEITGSNVKKNICIAANGNVFLGLTSEFDMEDHDNLGNILKEEITSMVLKWNFKYPILPEEVKRNEYWNVIIFNYENDNKKKLIEHLKLNDKSLEEKYQESKEKVYLYNVIKNYRRAIHEKLPYLSMEEIKTSSDMWFEMEKKIANNQITEEECNQKMDAHYAELVVKHSYDDVKEFHKQYPYLTVEECKELQELNNRMATPSSSLLVFMFEKTKLLARANELEKLNDYRKEHIGSAFNAE